MKKTVEIAVILEVVLMLIRNAILQIIIKLFLSRGLALRN